MLDHRHEAFILSSRDSTPLEKTFRNPSLFFPSPDTTVDSFDVFTVGGPTSHFANATSIFTQCTPLMHSTSLKATNHDPPQKITTPIPLTPMLPSSLNVIPVMTTATRPKIYDHSDLSSSSSFSGFSDTIIIRARPVSSTSTSSKTASPHPGRRGVITNEDLASLPRYHCSSGAPSFYPSSSLSRIPRPPTPTKSKPSLPTQSTYTSAPLEVVQSTFTLHNCHSDTSHSGLPSISSLPRPFTTCFRRCYSCNRYDRDCHYSPHIGHS